MSTEQGHAGPGRPGQPGGELPVGENHRRDPHARHDSAPTSILLAQIRALLTTCCGDHGRWIGASLMLLVAMGASAAMPQPTEEQLAMFLALPESQQRQLAEQYGISLDEIKARSNSRAPVTDVTVVQPLTRSADGQYQTAAPVNPGSPSYPRGTQGGAPGSYPGTYPSAYPGVYSGTYRGSYPEPLTGADPYREMRGFGAPPQQFDPGARLTSNPGDQTDARSRYPDLASLGRAFPDLEQAELVELYYTLVPDAGQPEAQRMPLRPFGYDLFAGVATTFAPVTEIPVPLDYRLGPGDTVRVQLYGKQSDRLEQQVTRDGMLELPDIGPLAVAGMSFEDLRKTIDGLVAEKFIGVESTVSLGELRSMRIFVLGESRTPGSYSVSSLSTVTNALFVSGGILETGSLRKIQLKRAGRTVATLDLYDLLMEGDTSADLRLQPGDVVFIPPVGSTVSVRGAVRRPAIYELHGERNVAAVLELAGGMLPDANLGKTRIHRFSDGQHTRMLDFDLQEKDAAAVSVQNGDDIDIAAVNALSEGFVAMQGEVTRPGQYAWKPGMRVSDLLHDLRADLVGGADLDYALIVRESDSRRRLVTLAVDLGAALNQPGSEADPLLHELDTLHVFPADSDRLLAMYPILQRMERQARPQQPAAIIEISGEVRYPGRYPLPINQTARNVLQAAGGMLDSSYTLQAEVARYRLDAAEQVTTDVMPLPLDALLRGEARFQFEGRDRLLVRRLSDYALGTSVTIEGEVRFPGEYTLDPGESLSDLIERAGGLTEVAFPEGTLFTRKALIELEAERLLEAERRLQKDLLTLQLRGSELRATPGDIGKLEVLLEEVRSSKPVGRLVVDLPAILAGIANQDVRLQNNDRIVIPPTAQSVSVIGEVQFATSHLFQKQLTLKDYLNRSGGLGPDGDFDRIYVVQANGSVWLPGNSGWFTGREKALRPGDTIVVPLDTERIDHLQLWTSISQITYQIALGAAAISSL